MNEPTFNDDEFITVKPKHKCPCGFTNWQTYSHEELKHVWYCAFCQNDAFGKHDAWYKVLSTNQIDARLLELREWVKRS